MIDLTTPERDELNVDHSPSSQCSIARYGLPPPVLDAFGLRDLHKQIRRDFSTCSLAPSTITRTSSGSSIDFTGDCRTNRLHRRIEEKESETEDYLPHFDQLVDASGFPLRWKQEKIEARQFIDDISAAEKLPVTSGVMNVSQNKQEVLIHAHASEKFYNLVADNAEGIGVKMNPNKTQLLCVSTAINYEVHSYIYIGDKLLISGDELKLLGYNFGRRPKPDRPR